MGSIFGPEISSLPDGYYTSRDSGPSPYKHKSGETREPATRRPEVSTHLSLPNELATRPHSEQIAAHDPQDAFHAYAEP